MHVLLAHLKVVEFAEIAPYLDCIIMKRYGSHKCVFKLLKVWHCSATLFKFSVV